MRISLAKIAFTMSVSLIAFATTAGAEANGDGCTIAGSKDALLTIEEFADFECPFCARGSETMKQVLRDYKDKIRLVFRNMPLPMHRQATSAAKAFSAVCLQSPAQARSFQDEIFSHQERLRKEGASFLFETAEKLGVNVDAMKIEMEGEEVAQILADDQRAAELHGFKGTPSFVIGMESVTGALPYDHVKRIIDRQLAESQK